MGQSLEKLLENIQDINVATPSTLYLSIQHFQGLTITDPGWLFILLLLLTRPRLLLLFSPSTSPWSIAHEVFTVTVTIVTDRVSQVSCHMSRYHIISDVSMVLSYHMSKWYYHITCNNGTIISYHMSQWYYHIKSYFTMVLYYHITCHNGTILSYHISQWYYHITCQNCIIISWCTLNTKHLNPNLEIQMTVSDVTHVTHKL